MNVLFLQRRQDITTGGFDFQESLSFWEGLFPETTGRVALLDNLKSFGEKIDISALQCMFNSQTQILFDVIEKNYDDAYVGSINQALEATSEDVLGWTNYFKPFLISGMESLYNTIHQCQVVLHPSDLFCYLVSAITKTLFQMSFRVLIAETNASREEGLLKGDDSVARATYYKEGLLKDASYLQTVYSRYQVLTDMMLNKTKMSCEYIESILKDYATNHIIIESELNGGASLGKLVYIRFGEGDTHNRGKSVAIIEFEHGQLVYKPRSLQIEQRYNAFIERINSERIPGFLDIKTIRLKDTGDAGWCEFVKQTPCTNESEVRNYYTRIGELLAIFYLFGSTDFHAENIIACGAYPMIIDMETLFSVGLFEEKVIDESIFNYIGNRLTYSVRSSAILPTIIRNRKAKKKVDLSGLSMEEEQESPYKSFCIMDPDKDTVHMLPQNLTIGGHDNSVKLNNRNMESKEYLQEILQGFEITYNYFASNQDSVLSYIEEHFSGLMFRVLVRGTVTYSQILSTMYHPNLVQSFIDREIYLNRLFLNADEKHTELIRAEINDMKIDDIPMFMAETDSRTLYTCSGQALSGIIQDSALGMLRKKIASMGEADLRFQKRVILYSYAELYRNNVYITGYRYNSIVGVHEDGIDTPVKALVDRVAAYCDVNSLSLVVGNHTERSWIGYLEIEEQFRQITPIGINLYDGNAGMALFYASLYRITHQQRYLDTTREVIRPIERYFEQNSIGRERQNGLYNGCSGVVYLYAALSDLLQDKYYKTYSDQLLQKMAESKVSSEQNDIIIGNAGAILVAARFSETGDTHINQYLHMLAERIIQSAEVHPNGLLIDKAGYTGYAHGTAGVSHALYKVYKRTGDARIFSVVKKMLAYERGQYAAEEHNYHRSLSDRRCDCKWCHGMPGILLNRLSLKEDGYSDALLDQEIEIGIRKVKEDGFGNDHCLCHGDIGNLLVLQRAADVTHDKALKQQVSQNAEHLAYYLIERMDSNSAFIENAGFGLMTGLAGIGYGMLALKYGAKTISNILAV